MYNILMRLDETRFAEFRAYFMKIGDKLFPGTQKYSGDLIQKSVKKFGNIAGSYNNFIYFLEKGESKKEGSSMDDYRECGQQDYNFGDDD